MRNRDDLRWLWQWRYAWHEKSVFVFERESERAKTERQTIPNSSVIGLGALRCDEIFLSKIFFWWRFAEKRMDAAVGGPGYWD